MSAQNVYIIGSKGCGNYGGYETFLDKLTEYHKNNKKIEYHIAWKGNMNKEFTYHNFHSFQINVPNIGAAQAIYYDVKALNYCLNHIRNNKIANPIVYVLACRIGPFANYFQKSIHKFGGKVFVNPDGHEWMRLKWNALIRKYWRISELMMIKHADLLVCDSKNIENYVNDTYKKYAPKTTFIAYGTDLKASKLKDDAPQVIKWYTENRLIKKEYYLIVGRFVPENSFEIMIREFMRSKSKRSLVIITTTNTKFLRKLEKKLHFGKDNRIKFVKAIYDQELLKKIRENAYAYLHGHTVGGTNPSLLESLGSTNVNLLVDVKFNREVAEDSALYWKKEEGNLAELINYVDTIGNREILLLGEKAKNRIATSYTWEKIAKQYDELFTQSSNFLY